MHEERIKVIYIGGANRSGSTLLDMMLGQAKGLVSIGELWNIWDRGFRENQLCGCRKKFKKCEFWYRVVEEAYGGLQNIDGIEQYQLLRFLKRRYYIPLLVCRWRTSKFNQKLKLYSDCLNKLYRAIWKVSGNRVIIDSSKHSSHGFIINNMSDIELYIVHLIRDSRAVSYSWQRKKLRPEIHWKKEFMPVQGSFQCSFEWDLENILISMLKYFSKHYILLHYEDLVNDPQKELSRLFNIMGEEVPPLAFCDRSKIDFGINHTISGNPIRFQKGKVEIRRDEEWKQNMDKKQKLIVNAITWPLLVKFGYLS